MINVHTHTWRQDLHFEAKTIEETQIARAEAIDVTVELGPFLADNAPFEKVVVFGMKARRTGYWVPDEYVAGFCANAPDKLIPFAGCDPTQPEYLEELHYAIDGLGMHGVKMGPIYAGFDPRDPRCRPVYAYCQERGLPIMFHSGTTYDAAAPLGYSRPWLFDEVAIAYPALHMVLAHVGHPFSDECLVVIRKHPHVYADISAIFYRPWQFYNTLIIAQEYGVTHKLLFGTDYPFAKAEESMAGLRAANDIIGDSGLPRVTDETIDGMLERDSLALLGLPA